MQSFINVNKWIDTWDLMNPTLTQIKDRATYGVKTFCKLRLDYVICSPALQTNIIKSMRDSSHEGSDHIPMGTMFSIISQPKIKIKLKSQLNLID